MDRVLSASYMYLNQQDRVLCFWRDIYSFLSADNSLVTTVEYPTQSCVMPSNGRTDENTNRIGIALTGCPSVTS